MFGLLSRHHKVDKDALVSENGCVNRNNPALFGFKPIYLKW
jgi:hypothetical protein